MNKRILLLTSAYTGHGHKSISDALEEQFALYGDVTLETAEAFALMGKAGVSLSKMYGPMTRTSKQLWAAIYKIGNDNEKLLSEMLSLMIHDGFLKKLESFRPDLIVTVHPLFNGSVLNLLDKYGIDIPVVSLQADIISIHRSWCDPRSAITMCPTQEAYDTSIAQDMPPEKLMLCGFPTRARFCDAARTHVKDDYDGSRPLRCLIMSGGEGSGDMRRYATEMLSAFDCRVTVVCGRNAKLRASLERTLERKYPERVNVLGFVSNVQDYMLDSDLVILRGSPNSLMEAVVCLTPMIVTGALPGQEAGNPTVIRNHRLGVICPSPEALTSIVHELVADRGARLRQIRASQLAYRNLDNAKNIVAHICAMAEHKEREMPPFPRYGSDRLRPRHAGRIAQSNRVWRGRE